MTDVMPRCPVSSVSALTVLGRVVTFRPRFVCAVFNNPPGRRVARRRTARQPFFP